MTVDTHHHSRSRYILFAVLSSVISSLATILKVQVVHYLNPLVAAPVALIAFGDTLTMMQATGALVVLITSALISKSDKKGARARV